MKPIKQILIVFLAVAYTALSSCSKDDEQVQTPVPIDPPPITHYTIKLGAGTNWDNSQPITGQNLQDHSVYQFGLFNTGTLKMAGFLLEKDEARYIQGVTTEEDIARIIEDDPAVVDAILAAKETEPISMIIEQTPDSSLLNNKSYFIVEYTRGPNWNDNKKLWELDLSEHQAYISGKFSEKFVLRACQFLNIDKAMYIVLADSIADVQNFINNDPAMTNKIFTGQIIPYTVNVEQL